MRKSVDLELLALLGKDARQNSDVLAKQLHISSATVRRKLREFLKKDILRISGIVDPVMLGFSMSVVIAINAEPSKVESVIERLVAEPRIWWLTTTTGRFDILLVARFSSSNELSDFLINVIEKIPGIRDTETSVCLDVRKGRYIPLLPSP
jgi:Lrp/AsnC family transcriptional regulator, regulator for asnA, asnC and gidA